VFLKAANRQLVAALRRERRELIQMIDVAMQEYRAAKAGSGA